METTTARQASLSITSSQSLLKLMSIKSVMPSKHLILCRPLLLLPSIFPCIRVFSNESVLHIRWPKHWSFSFSISPSSEYSGLISFRMDWFDPILQYKIKSFFFKKKKQNSEDVIKVLPSSEILESEPHWGMKQAWADRFSSDPFSHETLSKSLTVSEISIPNPSQSPPSQE